MVKTYVAAAVLVALGAGPAAAQVQPPPDSEQIRARQRISTMEAVIQRAVQNGADNVMRRVSMAMPEPPRLAGSPQVRGFRLPGYGVFFHVEVPPLLMPIMWPVWQMAQEGQNRALTVTIQRLRGELPLLQGEERLRTQRLIRDLEMQLGAPPASPAQPAGQRVAAASLPPGDAAPAAADAGDPESTEDPQAVYTREVKAALVDAMLENSQGLGIGPDEWLVIGAAGEDERSPLLVGNTVDASRWVVRVRGSDLAALRSGSLTLEQARALVVVTED